jgi:hypothetical protein
MLVSRIGGLLCRQGLCGHDRTTRRGACENKTAQKNFAQEVTMTTKLGQQTKCIMLRIQKKKKEG